MTTNLFQNAIINANACHRATRKNDMGASHFDAWKTLSGAICLHAYNCWSDTHDNAGREVGVVDEQTQKEHRNVLCEALKSMVATVGEVAFSDKNSAPLSINDALVDLVIGMSNQTVYELSDSVKELNKQKEDAKEALELAKVTFAFYNFNGVAEETKAEKAKAVQTAQAVYDALVKKCREETAKPYAKTPKPAPQDEEKFRKELEFALYDMISGQQAMDYADYVAKRNAQRKERKARHSAQKQAMQSHQSKMANEVAQLKAELAKLKAEAEQKNA